MLGHGGVSALGVNACVMTLPALAAGAAWQQGVVSNKAGHLLRAEVVHLRWATHFGAVVGAGTSMRLRLDSLWLASAGAILLAVAAIRVTPLVEEPWAVGEVLLHRAGSAGDWSEWLPADLARGDRARALAADPRPGREDWYYRSLLASRR